MKIAFKIFSLSLRFIFFQFRITVQVSGVLYLAMLGLDLTKYGLSGTMDFMILEALYLPSALVVSSWLAIAWHNYILRDALSARLVPAWPADVLVGYVLRSILVSLIVVLVLSFAYILSLFLTLSRIPQLPVFAWLPLAIVFVTYLSLRVSIILPAYAVGQPMSLHAAWAITKSHSNVIWGLSLIFVGAITAQFGTHYGLNTAFVFKPLAVICGAFLDWLWLLWFLSLLTSMYGYFV